MANFSVSVTEESMVSDFSEGGVEYFLNGLWEGEYGGTFGQDEKLGSSSFRKRLSYGSFSPRLGKMMKQRNLLKVFVELHVSSLFL